MQNATKPGPSVHAPSVARCYRGCALASKSPQSFAKRAREIAVREKRERKREKKAEAAAQKAAAAEEGRNDLDEAAATPEDE